MKCARLGCQINDKDEAILVRRGVWSDKDETVVVHDYGEDMPMEIVLCKACFQDITHKSSVKGVRVGFPADGDKMVSRNLSHG